MSLAALAGPVLLASAATGATLTGKVDRVIDGDAVDVRVAHTTERVRLVGIDTPETTRGRVQCGGPAATATARRLLARGIRVRLVTDPTQDERDRYGRLLAYVYRPGKSGLRSVNYALVRTGRAKVFVFRRAFRYRDQFFRAQHRARKAKRGPWGRRAGATRQGPTPAPAPAPAGAAIPTTEAPAFRSWAAIWTAQTSGRATSGSWALTSTALTAMAI